MKNEELRMKNGFVFEKEVGYENLIALKESRETEYWVKLLNQTEIINQKEYLSLYSDCEEFSKLLTSILKSSKFNIENS